MCDAGVQHKGSEVPAGGAGCADLRVCVQPEEHGGGGGEHLPTSGTVSGVFLVQHLDFKRL